MNEASPENMCLEQSPGSLTACDDSLAAVLAECDAACPCCGYNLRGLSKPDCPECGQAVTWASLLERTTPVSLAWVLGLVGLAVSLPESFLKWQRLAFRRLFFYGDQQYVPVIKDYIQPDATIANPLFVGSTLYWHLIPLAMMVWWIARRRIARWPSWLRWAAAGVLLAAAVLGHRRWMWWYYAMGYDDHAPWPLWYIDQR